MANFTIKLFRYTPGVFDQWGWEIAEHTGTEDNLNNTTIFPRNNVLSIMIRYIPTANRYGGTYLGVNFYCLQLFGAGVLDVVGFDQNVSNYRIGTTNGDFYFRINAQVGGEVNRKADLIRVSTLDQARVFTGRWTDDAVYQEMLRRLGGVYPPPPSEDPG